MELCEILTHIYGYKDWWNPVRSIGSIAGIQQSPYEAYQDLAESFQRIARSLYGKTPQKTDGLLDDSRPIDFSKYHNYEE